MTISNNKLTLAVHLFFRDQQSRIGSDRLELKDALTATDFAELAFPDHAAEVLRDLGFSAEVARSYARQYHRYQRGIRFAKDSLLVIERGSYLGEPESLLAESLYDYAEEVVPKENLAFFPKRGKKLRGLDNEDSKLRELAESKVGSKADFNALHLYSFGEYEHGCLTHSTCTIQRGMKNKAKIVGSFGQGDNLAETREDVGRYFVEHRQRVEKPEQVEVAWRPNEKGYTPTYRISSRRLINVTSERMRVPPLDGKPWLEQ